MTKLTGLHVWQEITTAQANGASGSAARFAFIAGDPESISATGMVAPGSDNKVYFRRYHTLIGIYNNSNTPCWVKVTRLYPKKNIPLNQFSNVIDILNEDATFTPNTWIDPFTSNTAQRYLKFGKSKWLYFGQTTGSQPPAYRLLSMKRKFKNQKLITGEIEGNSDVYFAIKGMTQFLYFQAFPLPVETTSPPQLEAAPQSFQFWTRPVLSWYELEESSPTSVAGPLAPTGGTLVNAIVPAYATGLPAAL